MQQTGEFFDLHSYRARKLLDRHFPQVELDMVDKDVLSATVLSPSRISISTTLTLIVVNVFFRALTNPGVLSNHGDPNSLVQPYSPYPGYLPTTLDELLDTSTSAIIQPANHQRALVAKKLADIAFDFQVLQLAGMAVSTSVKTDPEMKQIPSGVNSAFLAADGSALSKLLTMLREQTDDHDPLSGEELCMLFFSLSMLFFVVESLFDLPAAARIVHAQQALARITTKPYMDNVQYGCNEAILALAALTRRPPNLDGFNGILNPDSRTMLERALN
jgi:hypothetical protein